MNKLLRELDHGAMSGDLSCWSCIGYWVLTPSLVFGCNKECCRGPGTKLGLVFGLTWRKTQLVTGHRTLGVFQHQDYFPSKINWSIVIFYIQDFSILATIFIIYSYDLKIIWDLALLLQSWAVIYLE